MSAREELITQLEELLAEELRAHVGLAETGKQMREAITRKDVAAVQQLTGRYDSFVGRVEDLEERRLAICDQLAQAMGRRHVNIASVIATLPQDKRGALTSMRSALRDKISEVSKANVANRILLEATLHALDKNVEIMVRSQSKLQGYGQSGAASSQSAPRSILNKMA
ncbi:MAG: hypothetical protein GF418_13015 [Chitinivibrionales bacterium]|nr:hypothetical protein [Chitinivibrionales bacterium]MBD3396539.1 hypothetical protein [Chitinivibrionales bacterium]